MKEAPVQEPFGWWFTPNGEFLLPSELEVDNPHEYETYRPMYIDTPSAAQPAPVQEPVAWLEILRNNKTATDGVIGAFLRGHAEHLTGETFVLTTTPAEKPALFEPTALQIDRFLDVWFDSAVDDATLETRMKILVKEIQDEIRKSQ